MEMLSALDDLDAAWGKLAAAPVGALNSLEALAVLDRLERHRRRLPALEHALLVQAQSQGTAKEIGAKSWRAALCQRLGISGADAGRRLAEAADLGPRRTVTGQPVEPLLAATAAAQARGEIGAEHVGVVRDFLAALPTGIDAGTREAAESQLAGLAGGLTPEGLRQVARQLLGYLDPDGTPDDEGEHARKRGLSLSPQGLDGMSRLTGWLTPAVRTALDALLAKLAAPGHSLPDDPVDRSDRDTHRDAQGDTRSPAQRNHDALGEICGQVLASGGLGHHNGLPVTIVATTSLAELSAAAGVAHTGGGTRLPIRTLIRMAAAGRTNPYLALFDNPAKIRLYHGRRRRTASPGQRLALAALHRGCTKPGCDAPPNRTQVHHAHRDWQYGGRTDVNQLTLACGCDNRLVGDTPTGWTTRQRPADNRTEWIPPPGLDRGQPRINLYHHPEDILRPADDPADDPG